MSKKITPGIDMIVDVRHGEQTRLTLHGPVFELGPAYRENGFWVDPQIERQPLGDGGHRDGETVEVLGEAPTPPEAAMLGITAPFMYVRYRTIHRTVDGGFRRRERTDVVGLGKI